MVALTANQVKDLIRRAQECFSRMEHDSWDAERCRYRRTETEMWPLAAKEAVPPELEEWREIIRVLAQGETYYGGRY
jgi:hypothetical protein